MVRVRLPQPRLKPCDARASFLYRLMFAPSKTDVSTICPECGGVMHIAAVKALENEPRLMEHSFTCVMCLANASYKFPKKTVA